MKHWVALILVMAGGCGGRDSRTGLTDGSTADSAQDASQRDSQADGGCVIDPAEVGTDQCSFPQTGTLIAPAGGFANGTVVIGFAPPPGGICGLGGSDSTANPAVAPKQLGYLIRRSSDSGAEFASLSDVATVLSVSPWDGASMSSWSCADTGTPSCMGKGYRGLPHNTPITVLLKHTATNNLYRLTFQYTFQNNGNNGEDLVFTWQGLEGVCP